MRTLRVLLLITVIFVSCRKDYFPAEVTFDNTISITAKSKYPAIDSLVAFMDSTALLMNVKSAEIDSGGTAKFWSFVYATPYQPQRYYYLTAENNGIRLDSSVSSKILVGAAFMTHVWIDSDVATQIAESAGGRDFRTTNPGCVMGASLTELLNPEPTPCWLFTYQSRADPDKSLKRLINAFTGRIL